MTSSPSQSAHSEPMTDQSPNETLLSSLHHHATYTPDRLALIFLNERGTEVESITYGALYTSIQQLAVPLLEHRGQRALLLYPSGLRFVQAILACFYAGVIAVPAPIPTLYGHSTQRLSGLCQDAQVQVILSESQQLPLLEGWLSSLTPEVQVILTDQFSLSSRLAEPLPMDTAFLQYTSGSTTAPKGVVITHRSLLHNVEEIRVRFGHTPSSIVCSWLPMFHDMGLIGCLFHPLWMGMLTVVMTPMAFLKRPSVWLHAISRYHATTAGGPNFGYDLCVQRIKEGELMGLDLSSWQIAFNGSEPIRPRTLSDFHKRFAPYGLESQALYACYGLAESTLMVTAGVAQQGVRMLKLRAAALEEGRAELEEGEGLSRTLVSSGSAHGLTVMIVDPQGNLPLPEAQVGEVWVGGTSVAAGYWNQEDLSTTTFRAFTSLGQGPFLRTGDLGFLWEGELFITGRLKDLIILGGRNLYPQDLEEAALKLNDGVRGAAAFSVQTESHEALVLVIELGQSVRDEASFAALVQQVRAEMSQEFGVRVEAVVGVSSADFQRTTSRKVMRSGMHKFFVERRLNSVFETVSDALERHRDNAALMLGGRGRS